MNKKSILLTIFIIISSITLLELSMRIKRGFLPTEPLPSGFDYNYVSIYKKIFTKTLLSNGILVYKLQHVNRMGDSQYFQANKPKGSFRIFLLGGSVAYNFDNDNLQCFKEMMRVLMPKAKIEIINCGFCGYDSYRDSIVFREVIKYKPDLIILMSGNNECNSPVRVIVWAYKLNRFLRNLWIYRELQDNLISRFYIHRHLTFQGRLRNFKRNIRIMVGEAKQRKIPIALCTLPTNVRDYFHCCGNKTGHDFESKQYFFAWIAFQEGKIQEAIEGFKQYVIFNPENGYATYFLGKCYDELGNYSLAKEYYLKTIESEVHRCTPQHNNIIRSICKEEDIILVDLEKAFTNIAPHGLVGKEYLYDICHWYRDRYILVSEEIVKSALEYFKTHLNSSLIGSSQIENNHFLRIHDVAVSCPINLTARERAIEMLSHTMLHLHRNYDIVLEEESLSSIKIAYQLAPEVFESRDFLKEQLSRVFYSQGYTPGNCLNTEEFWDTFLMYFAETLRRLGEYAKAIDYFDEVNNREQNFCFLYLGRSMAYCKIGQTERAKADFEELSKRNCNNKALELYRELLRF